MPQWRARIPAGFARAIGFAVIVATLLCGCFVPLDDTLVSESTLGSRTGPTDTVVVTIVDRVVKQRILAPMTEEGYGRDYLLRHRYYLTRGAEELRLPFLEVDAIDVLASGAKGVRYPLREIEPEVRPIAGTTSWVALRVREVAPDYLAIELIVFDDALHHRGFVPDRVQRRSRSPRLLAGNLEFVDGNRRILFATAEGDRVIDIAALLVTKQPAGL